MSFDLTSFSFTDADDIVTRLEQLLVPSLTTIETLQGSDTLSGDGEIGILIEEGGTLDTGTGEDVISGAGSRRSSAGEEPGRNPRSLAGVFNNGALLVGDGNDVITGEFVAKVEPGGVDRFASGINNGEFSLISTGDGNDVILGTVIDGNAGILNSFTIDTGTGNDIIVGRSQGLGAGIVTIGTLDTGDGDDRISAETTLSPGATSFLNVGLIATATGNDVINATGGQFANISLLSTAIVDTGEGNDRIIADGLLSDGIIDTGEGNDTITSVGDTLGITNSGMISTGDGNDVVTGEATGPLAGSFSGLDGGGTIDLGEGNDTLIGFGTQTVLGGSGFDVAVFDFASTDIDQVSLGSSSGIDIEITAANRTLSLGGVESLQFTDDFFTPSQLLAARPTPPPSELLSVSFSDIDLPDTINFGDNGSVTLEITNSSGQAFSGPASLDLFISTDADRDSVSDERNDGLLNTVQVDLNLAAGQSTTVEIDYENLSSVVAPGAYHLLAGVSGGELTSELVSAPGSDAVLAWHATALNAIQEFGEVDNDSTRIGIVPTFGSRALAIVQTSVFNAANAFEEKFESFLELDPGSPKAGASIDAAVAGASATALASVFPGTQDLSRSIIAQLEETLALSRAQVERLLDAAGLGNILGPSTPGRIPSFAEPFLSEIPKPSGAALDLPSDIVDGFLLGVNAASQVLDARSGDGFTGFFDGIDDPANYEPPSGFGDYVWQAEILLDSVTGESVFTDADGNPVPFGRSPFWGTLDSFNGQSIDNFFNDPRLDVNGDGVLLDGRPFANVVDPVVDSLQETLYISEVNQVQELGGLESTDITTITRSQDQTEIAVFWAYDRADTYRPYGQLHQIAQEAAFRSGDDLVGSARTLALTSIALADAAIAAWFNKYESVQPRPADVISGDNGQGIPISAIDRFDATVPDLGWEPLLIDPPFPDYISGHSTVGGAFGGVLDTLFPDATNIQVVSQEIVPGNGIFTTSNDDLFNVADFSPVRTFDSYGAIGREDAISRVFGGLHVLESTQDAVIIGNEIGTFVANNLLAPII